jgi:hypothetical protein
MIALLLAGTLLGASLWVLWDWWSNAEPPRLPPARSSHPTVLRRLDVLLTQADLPWRAESVLMLGATGGVLAGGLVGLLIGWPVVGVFVAALVAASPFLVASWRRSGRMAQRQEALLGALERIRSELGTVTLQEALLNAQATVPPILAPAFRQIAQDLRQHRSLAEALRRSQVRLPDRAWSNCVAAFLLAETLGGAALGEILGGLIRSVRADLELQQALAAQQVRHIESARMTLVLPIVVVLFLRTGFPGAAEFYAQPIGELILLGCA